MFGFNYFTPTKVVFGRGTEARTAELIPEFGGRKVLIHYVFRMMASTSSVQWTKQNSV